jgi:hypothetical protein
LFGWPESIKRVAGHYSTLQGDSEDVALYLARYKTMLLSLHLDYFGRLSRREVELYTQEDIIVGDFVGQQVRFLNRDETINLSETRVEYQKREIEAFLAMMHGAPNPNPPEVANRMLQLALADEI